MRTIRRVSQVPSASMGQISANCMCSSSHYAQPLAAPLRHCRICCLILSLTVREFLLQLLGLSEEKELPRGLRLRVPKNLLHRSGLCHASVVQDCDPVTDLRDHTHLVGDDHDGNVVLPVHLPEKLQNGPGGLRVQSTGGFIA